MIHELKTWPSYFQEVFMSHKTFEARENDRDFKIGDTLILREWDNENKVYTGRSLARTVTYILQGGSFGVQPGHCIMSIQ